MHHDVPSDERRRLAALYETGLLYSEASSNFDRIARIAKALFHTQVSLVSLAAQQEIWHKSLDGCKMPTLPRQNSFCAHTIQSDDSFVVHDAFQDKQFSIHPRVAAGPRIRFYAGAPIVIAPGVRLGAVSILDQKPRHFTSQDCDALHMLAHMVVTEITLLGTARALRDVLCS